MSEYAEAGRVVVDGANVVGSRPDGWWRDRPGAARRLVDRLQPLGERRPVTVVLKGDARTGVEAGRARAVTVVHAAGSGDDAIAPLAAPGVTVVTADRELRARCRAAGAEVAGPAWLDALVSAASGAAPQRP